jgi:hypothetical protein
VYVSYSPGAHPVQRGPWYANLNGIDRIDEAVAQLVPHAEHRFGPPAR